MVSACSRGKDARDIRPLLACLPASSYPCPWTRGCQGGQPAKFSTDISERCCLLWDQTGLVLILGPVHYNYRLGQVARLPSLRFRIWRTRLAPCSSGAEGLCERTVVGSTQSLARAGRGPLALHAEIWGAQRISAGLFRVRGGPVSGGHLCGVLGGRVWPHGVARSWGQGAHVSLLAPAPRSQAARVRLTPARPGSVPGAQ